MKRSERKQKARQRLARKMQEIEKILNQANHVQIFDENIAKTKAAKQRIRFTKLFVQMCRTKRIKTDPLIGQRQEYFKKCLRSIEQKRKRARKKSNLKSKINPTFSSAYDQEGNFFKLIFTKT